MSGDAGPVTWRLANALAARNADGSEAAPPLVWMGAGSAVVALLRRVAHAISAVTRPLDGAGRALAARPLVVLAVAVLAVPLTQIAGVPALGLVLATLAGLALLTGAAHALHEGDERTIVVRTLLLGAILRAVFAAFLTSQGGFPDETGTYHPIAADAASCWRAGGPDTMAANLIVQGRAAYFHLLAAVYFAFGSWMIAGRILGGLLGVAAALAAGETARALGGRRAAAFGVAALALHPEHALWSVTLARDTLTTLLVLVTFAILLRRPGTLTRGNLLLAAVPVGLLALNSFLVAGALAATLAAMVLSEALVSSSGVRRVATAVVAVAIAGAALVYVGNRYGGWFTPEMFTAARGRAIGSEADFLPSMEFTSWWGVAAFVPLGAAFVLGAPWPWDAVHTNRAAYGVMALAGVAISIAGIAGLVAAARRRPSAAAPVVLFALILLVLLASLEGNSGIVVRHRLPLTACLAAGAGALFAGLRREK